VKIRVIAPLRPDDPPAVGSYSLVGQLGCGGMGRVFLGRSADGPPVAVKVIRAELASDPEFRERFRHEVAAARKVSGKFTPLVVDADLDGSVPWLATAYVAGPSLAEAVKGHGPLPVNKVLSLAAGLAEGLVAIHAAGVVHRDLKPSNVLLAEDGPQVIDFGISWVAWASATPGWSFGSPGFMSPEHALGQAIGPPSDIFSLGAVLTFAATGQGPFGSGSSAALIYRLVNSPARLDSLPAELRELVASCLAKHPGDRPTASGLLARVGATQRQSGSVPEPSVTTSNEGQRTAGTWGSTNGVTIPALVGVSSGADRAGSSSGIPGGGSSSGASGDERSTAEPQPGNRGRDLRHRVSRSLPLFVPGLLAAGVVAIYLLTGGFASSPTVPAQAQAGTTGTPPAAQAQPQAAGTATMPGPGPHATVTHRGSASARQDRIGPGIIQGPSASAFLSPSGFAAALTVPSPSGIVTPGDPAPPSGSSGSTSPSPKGSSSGSTSPSPKGSSSGSTSPSPKGSSSGSGSPSPPPSTSSPPPSTSSPPPSTSSPPTPATSTPTTPATSTPTSAG
jgi:serine/threonine protein kinase